MLKVIEKKPIINDIELTGIEGSSAELQKQSSEQQQVNTIDKPEQDSGHQDVDSVQKQEEQLTGVTLVSPQKKKNTSEKIIARNQANSQHSTGPKDTRRTRFNALRHGLRAAGLTKFDDAEEYSQTVREVAAEVAPRGLLNEFMVERAALGIVRSRRAQRMEGDIITAFSSPSAAEDGPGSEKPLIDPVLMKEYLAPALNLVLRYDAAIINQVLRLKRELERSRDKKSGAAATERYDEGGELIN
jgi:hypothetical protein